MTASKEEEDKAKTKVLEQNNEKETLEDSLQQQEEAPSPLHLTRNEHLHIGTQPGARSVPGIPSFRPEEHIVQAQLVVEAEDRQEHEQPDIVNAELMPTPPKQIKRGRLLAIVMLVIVAAAGGTLTGMLVSRRNSSSTTPSSVTMRMTATRCFSTNLVPAWDDDADASVNDDWTNEPTDDTVNDTPEAAINTTVSPTVVAPGGTLVPSSSPSGQKGDTSTSPTIGEVQAPVVSTSPTLRSPKIPSTQPTTARPNSSSPTVSPPLPTRNPTPNPTTMPPPLPTQNPTPSPSLSPSWEPTPWPTLDTFYPSVAESSFPTTWWDNNCFETIESGVCCETADGIFCETESPTDDNNFRRLQQGTTVDDDDDAMMSTDLQEAVSLYLDQVYDETVPLNMDDWKEWGFPMNEWCVSNVTNFDGLFSIDFNPNARFFNEALDKWDTSSATSMEAMFEGAALFNQDIGGWDTSRVTNMASMFRDATFFHQDLHTWNVSRVTDMTGMFAGARSFDGRVDAWDTSRVTDMGGIWDDAQVFNQALPWDVSRVTNMESMFYNARAFDKPLNDWNVSSVTDMTALFQLTDSFYQELSSWDVSQVTSMQSIFRVSWVSGLSEWDVSNVRDFSQAFEEAIVEDDLSDWDVSSATTMALMFANTYDNPGDLSRWNVSVCRNFESMFFGAAWECSVTVDQWNISPNANVKEMCGLRR